MKIRASAAVWIGIGVLGWAPSDSAETQAAQAMFRGVGDLPGGKGECEALGISDDGAVIIGKSRTARFEQEAWLVRDSAPPVALAGGAGARVTPLSGEPRGVTTDGRVVVGKIATDLGPCEAARWTPETGWVGLGDLDGGDFASQALGVSDDAAVIVGWGASAAGLEAARWVRGGGAQALGDLPGGPHHSAAALVARDGRTIVGTGHSPTGPEVFTWTEAEGMKGLGDLPGGEFSSEPFGMTPDAAVIVGESTSEHGVEAFRWTRELGMTGLGDLPGGPFESIAFDVSADGATVVGYGHSARGKEAFVWSAASGIRSLAALLEAAGVTDAQGWTLTEASGISADGRVIVGTGKSPSGALEGWIVRMPGT